MSNFVSIFYELFLKSGFNLALFFIVIGYPLIAVTYYVTHGLLTRQFPRQFLWFLPFVFCCSIVLIGARENISPRAEPTVPILAPLNEQAPTSQELAESSARLSQLEADSKRDGAIVETFEIPNSHEISKKDLGLDEIGRRFGGKK